MNKNIEESFIRIDEITLTLDEDESALDLKIVKILGINIRELARYNIVKRAIDSRKKENILFVYSLDVLLSDPQKYLSRPKQLVLKTKKMARRHKVRWVKPYVYEIKKASSECAYQRHLHHNLQLLHFFLQYMLMML